MAVEWTTAAIVKSYLRSGVGFTATLSDGDIEEMIEQSEGAWETFLKIPASFAFNASLKPHKALRKLITLEVCMMVVASCSPSFLTLGHAGLISDIHKDQYTELRKQFLENPGYRDFILNAEA